MSPDPPSGNGHEHGLHHGRHHDLDDARCQPHRQGQDALLPGMGDDASTIAVVDPDSIPSKPTTTGLHSPPDSNNVDGSTDSELSDLDEAIANADDMKLDSLEHFTTTATTTTTTHDADPAQSSASIGADESTPDQPEQVPTPEQDEDIGEVLPDHWSGSVPIFKPTMDQFKDFKKFVCPHSRRLVARMGSVHSVC